MLVAMMSPAFPESANRRAARERLRRGRRDRRHRARWARSTCIVFFPQWIITMYEWAVRKLAPKFEEQGRQLLLSFASGLGVLRHPSRFFRVLLWTIAHWLLNGVAFLCAFRAVGITAPFSAALLLAGTDRDRRGDTERAGILRRVREDRPGGARASTAWTRRSPRAGRSASICSRSSRSRSSASDYFTKLGLPSARSAGARRPRRHDHARRAGARAGEDQPRSCACSRAKHRAITRSRPCSSAWRSATT